MKIFYSTFTLLPLNPVSPKAPGSPFIPCEPGGPRLPVSPCIPVEPCGPGKPRSPCSPLPVHLHFFSPPLPSILQHPLLCYQKMIH